MDLDINQHERFQQREWAANRLGWVLLGLFIVAGLVGLLGTGPLSWTTTDSRNGVLTLEHDRVTHYEADDTITLTVAPDAVVDGTVTVQLTGSWPSGVDVQSISPEPAEQRAVPDGLVLEVPVEGGGDVEISVNFRAQEIGTLSGDVAVGDDTVSFSQFVMP
ncbi:hypothetical protein [Georgenia sp. SUBG003]|uniref:hypothetical protein n=1 Tax=Georgenia sp. SUBG003 TaxID=1497974 RepID=UPI0004D568EE|nr:hypothetical protein DA06_16515 [Georgenia sp. SUBG003]